MGRAGGIAGALVALVALGAVAAPAGAASVAARTARGSWTADVLAPVVARAAPHGRATPIAVLRPVAPIGGPTVLAVRATRRAPGAGGRLLVRVLLPIRPNGRQGWVPADVLRVRRTALRLLIDQSERRLTLFRAGRPALRAPVAVGGPATPTPNGRFAVAELIRTRERGASLGPVAFALTGYSEKAERVRRRRRPVAVHGTSLPGLIGTRASNGCIRLRNRDAVRLLRVVRPGTPVVMRR